MSARPGPGPLPLTRCRPQHGRAAASGLGATTGPEGGNPIRCHCGRRVVFPQGTTTTSFSLIKLIVKLRQSLLNASRVPGRSPQTHLPPLPPPQLARNGSARGRAAMAEEVERAKGPSARAVAGGRGRRKGLERADEGAWLSATGAWPGAQAPPPPHLFGVVRSGGGVVRSPAARWQPTTAPEEGAQAPRRLGTAKRTSLEYTAHNRAARSLKGSQHVEEGFRDFLSFNFHVTFNSISGDCFPARNCSRNVTPVTHTHVLARRFKNRNVFCKDFLNNFIEEICFILYLLIFIHIYL